MPTLNIPSVGTRLELDQDWHFSLYDEYRNDKFWDAYNSVYKQTEKRKIYNRWEGRKEDFLDVILPKDTILTIDRIYIRKGKENFDSITFIVKSCPVKSIKGRFWVKLEDVNKLSYK